MVLTYLIASDEPQEVGLSGAIYNEQGEDVATGAGDVDAFPLRGGVDRASLKLPVPANLAPGTYRIVAEVWAAHRIGTSATLARSLCTTFTVP